MSVESLMKILSFNLFYFVEASQEQPGNISNIPSSSTGNDLLNKQKLLTSPQVKNETKNTKLSEIKIAIVAQ